MKKMITTAISYLAIIFFLMNIYSIEGVIKNFKLPLFSKNMDNTGNITGSEAEFRKNGLISVKDPEASVLIPDLNKVFKFKSENCLYDKKQSSIVTDTFVSLSTEGLFIDGKGMTWDFAENRFTIKENVTMDIESTFKFDSAGAKDD